MMLLKIEQEINFWELICIRTILKGLHDSLRRITSTLPFSVFNMRDLLKQYILCIHIKNLIMVLQLNMPQNQTIIFLYLQIRL